MLRKKKLISIILSFILTFNRSIMPEKISKKFTNSLFKKKRKLKLFNKEGRQLEEKENWHEIKIKVDYSNIINVSQKIIDFIKKTIIPTVINRLKSIIKVKGNSTILGFSKCDEIKVPESYSKTITNTDLIIFIKFTDELTNSLASSINCQKEKLTNRPTVGIIKINKNNLKPKAKFISQMTSIITHEIIHIIALILYLFESFTNKNKKIIKQKNTNKNKKIIIKEKKNGKQIYKLTTPKLVQTAKSHFNCATITGVYLENNGTKGSTGSHFEKLHYGNEIMVSISTGLPSLSKLTLSLLEDTGWYRVNYLLADELTWGKDKGCAFVEDYSCKSGFSEFCQVEREVGCSDDFVTKTFCVSYSNADGCLIADFPIGFACADKLGFVSSVYQGSRVYEQLGAFSRCFKTVLRGETNLAGCFVAKCEDRVVFVRVGRDYYRCFRTGYEIFVDDLVIICPDAADFCGRLEGSCENDCSGNGRCLVGKTCLCDYFYEGDICDQKKICSSETFCQSVFDSLLLAFKNIFLCFVIFI